MNTAIAFMLNPGTRTALFHGLATGFAIDIRLMAVVLPAASLAILILRVLRRELPAARTLVSGAIYVAATFVFAIAMWVWLWSDPVGNFLHAFAAMAKFSWQGDTLYMGAHILGTELPWHYIPVWISITTPLLYLALFVVGAGAIVWRLALRGLRLWNGEKELQDLFFLGLFVSPIVAIIALQSVVYGGWRHLYFVYPAFLLIAVRGLHLLWTAGKAWPLARATLVLVTAVGLLHVAIWMWRAHPLQNVYFNVLAGSNVKTRYDLDYWGLANRQALEYILRHDPSSLITVGADSETPLHSSIDMLPPADRARLREAADGERAHYLITNYHGEKESDATRRARGYDLFHEIVVDGETVLSIFKRMR